MPVVKVKVKGKTYSIKTEEYVNIDLDDLKNEFSTQASRYAWLASLRAHAVDESRTAEALYELEWARACEEIRDAATVKTTETAIKNRAQQEKQVIKALHNWNAVHYVADQLTALTKSMEHRMSMLQQLGAAARAELELYSSNSPRRSGSTRQAVKKEGGE